MDNSRGPDNWKKRQFRERRKSPRPVRDNLFLLMICAVVCILYLTCIHKIYVRPVPDTNGTATAESGAAAWESLPSESRPTPSASGSTATQSSSASGSTATQPSSSASGSTASSASTSDSAVPYQPALPFEPVDPESSSSASEPVCIADPDFIPDYSGQDVLELNDNKPSFTDEEIASITGEHFSELDGLGRCGTVYAMLHRSMMPTGKRGSISEIRPSGWKQKKYPGIVDSDPPYLWNRSHLIAYGMTGQTANERNLITGSRYMNATTMLPYEESVMWYLHGSNNHVLYRVTPFFKGSELVARGVEMEAYSVEDHGRGVSFHVFVYNVQPGIGIDYRTGESWQE